MKCSEQAQVLNAFPIADEYALISDRHSRKRRLDGGKTPLGT